MLKLCCYCYSKTVIYTAPFTYKSKSIAVDSKIGLFRNLDLKILICSKNIVLTTIHKTQKFIWYENLKLIFRSPSNILRQKMQAGRQLWIFKAWEEKKKKLSSSAHYAHHHIITIAATTESNSSEIELI